MAGIMATNAPDFFVEIFLQPGDFYWGDSETRIRTLLGSCVALTLWHPREKVGGMCHIMLPARPRTSAEGNLDGRYADEAMLMFLNQINKMGARPEEFQCKMFGGSNMFATLPNRQEQVIGDRNVEAARALIERYRLKLAAEDTGGIYHRRIYFDIWSGDVWLKKTRDEERKDPLLSK